MTRLRILLVEMPQLLRDLVSGAFRGEVDIEVVGNCALVEMLDAARATSPDFVVTGVEGSKLPAECRALLAELPSVRILGIEPCAGHASLYYLVVTREAIGEVSPRGVVDAVRAAAARPPSF